MSVQVAIRVRPFNQREKDLKTQLCVSMKGPQTTLIDLEDEENTRTYTFDYSFWSHDGYAVSPEGMLSPDSPSSPYVDQKKVFDYLGNSILENAFEGYHCSLFAYGQTGAGKSFSVMGYKPNIGTLKLHHLIYSKKGIVPIVCQEIFQRTKDKIPGVTYEVFFGMLEIYNENAQDLLIDIDERPQRGMRIRQKRGIGFYAQGQKKVPVRNYAEIEEWMDIGNQNRSIASTQMNATSSRAHTIIMIEFKQIKEQGSEKLEKLSVINLVDLAGSEKVGKTGAKGDRLKEAQNINKSLSMLGLVISTLADIQSGKEGLRVPYRDSTLTKLLANALGGNSKTIMICAISPAYDNFDESLSTLRYADQAKKIKNQAVVNEDPTDKLIRELHEENKELKEQLEKFEKFFGKNMNQSNPNFKRFQKMKDNLNENEKQLEDKKKSQEERVEEFRNKSQMKRKVDQNQPHLWVISEDPQLDGKMVYPLVKPEVVVGNQQGVPTPEIKINGIGVRPLHCKILCMGQELKVQPIATDFLYLNGEQITQVQKLYHNDRIIFGTNSTFLVKIPSTKQRDASIDPSLINYEFMVKEWHQIKEKAEKERKEEMLQNYRIDSQDRLKRAEEQHQLKVKLMKEEIESQKAEYENKIAELKNSKKLNRQGTDLMKISMIQMLNQSRLKDKLASQSQVRKTENFQKKLNLALLNIPHERHRNRLRRLVDEVQPKVDMMNVMASDMGRDIKFVLKIKEDDPENLKILVQNKETDTQYHWDLEKALNRYYMQKEVFTQEIQENRKVQKNINIQGDPFYDESDPKQIGKCQLALKPFVYFMDNPSECWLFKHASQDIKGILKVNVFPTDQNGINNMGRIDNYLSDPQKLIGKTVYVKICIEEAWLLPGVSDIYVEFNFDGKAYRTQVIQGKHLNPYFCYAAIHTYQKFNQDNLDYFMNHSLVFRVYGDFIRGDWDNHDKGFAGKKEKQLYWLCNPIKEIQDQDVNIEIDSQEFLNSSSSSSSSDSDDRQDSKKIRKHHRKNHYSNRMLKLDCFKTLEDSRQCGIFFVGLLCVLIFASHASLTGLYRNDYDIFKQNETDRRVTQETDETVDFWVRHSYMLASSMVLTSAICVMFFLQGQKKRIKEFLYMTMLPFCIWIGSSSSWLRADRKFQDTQFLLVQDMKDEKMDIICKNAMKNCEMALSFDRLYSLTIFALILGIPLYLYFMKSVVYYLEYRRLMEYEAKIMSLKHKKNKGKKETEIDSLMGLKKAQSGRVDIEQMNVQRIDTQRIDVQIGLTDTQGQEL